MTTFDETAKALNLLQAQQIALREDFDNLERAFAAHLVIGGEPVPVPPEPEPVPPNPTPGSEPVVGVSGNKITVNGVPKILRGSNQATFWGAWDTEQDSGDLATYDEKKAAFKSIAEAGATCTRIVQTTTLSASLKADADGKLKRELVEAAIAAGLVPILEMHEATGDKLAIYKSTIEPYWLRASTVAMCKAHPSLILNLANELDFASVDEFKSVYMGTVKKLRDLGVANVIMLDGDDNTGNSANGVLQRGESMQAEDPLHKLVFSIHPYSLWHQQNEAPTWAKWVIERDFPRLGALSVPVFLGEFGGSVERAKAAGEHTQGLNDYNYDPIVIMNAAKSAGLAGWCVWADYDKPDRDQFCMVKNMGARPLFAPGNLSVMGKDVLPRLKTG